jgi:hypothetical protein
VLAYLFTVYLTSLFVAQSQWRTQDFFSGGVHQIKLRTEGREYGDLGGGNPLVRNSVQFANV